MNKLAIALAIATVAALDLIVVVGAGLPASATGERLLAVAVPTMDLCLVLSSVLLGRLLLATGHRTLGTLLMFNLVLFAAAAVLRVLGSIPPRWVLFAADLYWLNLYLVTLSTQWSAASGRPVAA
jgi:hypothetical protein